MIMIIILVIITIIMIIIIIIMMIILLIIIQTLRAFRRPNLDDWMIGGSQDWRIERHGRIGIR